MDDYRKTRRGAVGVKTIKTGGRNGSVVAVLPVTDASEILVTTQGSITIRLSVGSVRDQGRNTMGVRIIRLEEGDSVRDAVVLASTLEGAEAETPGDAPPDAEDDVEEPESPSPAEPEDGEEPGDGAPPS